LAELSSGIPSRQVDLGDNHLFNFHGCREILSESGGGSGHDFRLRFADPTAMSLERTLAGNCAEVGLKYDFSPVNREGKKKPKTIVRNSVSIIPNDHGVILGLNPQTS